MGWFGRGSTAGTRGLEMYCMLIKNCMARGHGSVMDCPTVKLELDDCRLKEVRTTEETLLATAIERTVSLAFTT